MRKRGGGRSGCAWRRVASRSALALFFSLLVPLGWTACEYGRPGGYRARQRIPTVPISRSERERPNQLTYYLASVSQEEDVVFVDLDVLNGHGRGFTFITVWVMLLGTEGEKYEVPYAMGGVAAHSQQQVVLKAKNITFQVADVSVALQIR